MKNEEIAQMSARISGQLVQGLTAAGHPPELTRIPRLIEDIGKALRGLYGLAPTEAAGGALPVSLTGQQPAVPVEKSVTPEHIICLEDGKKMKMLRRHLRTAYSMSPAEYRAKWGLPWDYPMVAPNYHKQKSKFARHVGLGKRDHAKVETTAAPALPVG